MRRYPLFPVLKTCQPCCIYYWQVVGLVTAMAGPTGYAANPARDLGPRIAHFVLPIPNKVVQVG